MSGIFRTVTSPRCVGACPPGRNRAVRRRAGLLIFSFPRAVLALCALAALPGAASAQRAALDPTVGASTRREEFAGRQAEIDPEIRRLTGAPENEQAAIGREIAQRFGRDQRIENLIRYREPAMAHVFAPLLADDRWSIRARALYGLKMTGGPGAVEAALGALRDPDFRVREQAAGCLGHIAGELPEGFDELLAAEKDPWVAASLEAARKTILAGRPYRPWEESLEGPAGARRVAWAWTVQGSPSFTRYDARTLESPEATGWDWPISWYEGGLFVPFPRASFGGSAGHAGEDMAWFREGAGVYAVADGLVRLVQGAGGNWGFLVVLEHREPDGSYVSSVYGHLAFDILVAPGETVRRGRKLGTVGLSCSVENGGYGAHLHFGLAANPFRKPAGLFTGSRLTLNRPDGATFQAEVVGFAYLPDRTDSHGFPGLGVRVALPGGGEQTLGLDPGPIGNQVNWIAGYAPGTRGWHDPYRFILDRREPSETGR